LPWTRASGETGVMDDSRVLDWQLGVDTVSRLVAQQFPALGGERIVRLGAGCDHELYSVGQDWILRFPKRAERVPWLLREIEIMPAVADPLEQLVARFELVGHPGSGCPYPFVGHRRLIGVAADQAPQPNRALAADIGQALSRLHRVAVDRIPPPPGGGQGSGDQLAIGLQAVAEVVEPLLSSGCSRAPDRTSTDADRRPRVAGSGVWSTTTSAPTT